MNEAVVKNIKNELHGQFPNVDVRDVLEVYEQFANLNINVEGGLANEWIKHINGFYALGDDMRSHHDALLNSESFFKKILYVVNKSAYEETTSDKKLCLYNTMKSLKLFEKLPDNIKPDRADPDAISDPFNRAVVRTYQLRNQTSHTSQEWSLIEMATNVNAILFVTMYAVWKNVAVIRTYINKTVGEDQFGITTLLQEIVKNYNRQKSNGFVYVPLLWESEEADTVTSQQKRIEIEELLTDRHILLSGEAGCGKTTSLQYLEYQAANSYLAGKSSKIPVNIELINESANSTLEDMICRKLNIPLEYCEKLLQKGLLYLLIDGLNELTLEIAKRQDFVTRIEQFYNHYPRVFIILTDRKFSSYPIRVDKTYHLKRMEKEDIIAYAKTKTECDGKTLELLEEVLNKPTFAELEYTPLMVNQLIIALSSDGKVPNDASELVGVYLEALMKREHKEKREVNAAPYKLETFLMRLASEDDSTDGVPYIKALLICKSVIDYYGITLNSDDAIALAIQMGILKECGENKIAFAFDEYRTYYYIKAIDNDVFE